MSTIRDVAREANVSTATVSRVLNNDKQYKITEETKQRVIQAAKRLNYAIPLRTTRHPGSEIPSSRRIGCILSVTRKKFNDPYFMAILSGAEERLREKGYDISFIKTGAELSDRDCLLQTFQEDIAGLILMETLDAQIYHYISRRVPYIVGIDTQVTDIDNVAYDHHQVGFQATQHLIDAGHKKIGYIGGSGDTKQIRKSQRYQGYYMAMMNADLPVNEKWVIDCEWDDDICIEKVDALCKDQDIPTAFFVGSDLMALATINALSHNGLSVPRDVAVMGMTDLELAKLSTPSLTTMHIPMDEIGVVAADLLISRITGKKLLPQKVILPATLVQRDSV